MKIVLYYFQANLEPIYIFINLEETSFEDFYAKLKEIEAKDHFHKLQIQTTEKNGL